MVEVHSTGKLIQTEQISKLIIGGQTGADAIQFFFRDSLNGVDLSNPLFEWFLQFKNKNGEGESVLLPSVHEDEYVKLTWIPGLLATQVPGRMQIQIYATIVEGEGEAAVMTTKWVSEPAVVYVQENITPNPIVSTELTIFQQYLVLFQAYEQSAHEAMENALESEQAAHQSEVNANGSEDAAGVFASSSQQSRENALLSEQAANAAALSAALSKDESEAAAIVAVGAAGAANGWMDIDGVHYVVSRQAKGGHIIKSITLYEEVV